MIIPKLQILRNRILQKFSIGRRRGFTMPFSSLDFLFAFLPCALLAYVSFPARFRNIIILLSSLTFYAWSEHEYAIVLVIYIVANWVFGRSIENTEPGSSARGTITAAAIISNLFGLLYFKYTGFLLSNTENFVGFQIPNPNIHLPIGISFFAFQGISYVVDVSRGQVNAARSLITFGAYKAFFPQLIAGPIVRYKDVASDFNRRIFPHSADVAAGIRRFAVGLAKKVLIANTLAGPADAVFGTSAGLTPAMAWFGVICYALQIYFDFSGYSDMAIGLGRIFGIHIPENFRYPYAASTVRDFWQRWHISLSTWFRDYVYIPLGGSRVGPARTVINLWIVFLLCGAWHGAEWTFVLWGAWHGAFLAFEHLTSALRSPTSPAARIFGHAYTILVVLLGWVLFRSVDVSQALHLFGVMFGTGDAITPDLLWIDLLNGQIGTAFVVGCIASTCAANRMAERFSVGVRNAATILSFVLCTCVLASAAFNPFIYFRF